MRFSKPEMFMAVTQIQKVNDKWKNSFTYRSEGDLHIRMGCNRIIYMRRAQFWVMAEITIHAPGDWILVEIEWALPHEKGEFKGFTGDPMYRILQWNSMLEKLDGVEL